MFKKITLALLLLTPWLVSGNITLHMECHLKPYSYCVDGQPRGVVVDIIESLFDKFENYRLTMKPIDEEAHNIKIIAPIQEQNLSKYSLLDYSEPILEMNGTAYRIGFTVTSFPEKKDLIKKINLAIDIMHDNHQIKAIVKKTLPKYLGKNQHQKITIGVYRWGEKMLNKDVEGYGLIPEIITASFAQKDIEVRYEFFEYPYTYLLTKWGKLCVSGPWLDRGDRRNYLYFSENIFTTKVYLYYNKKHFKEGIVYRDTDDLSNYKVGGVTGMYYEKEAYFKDKKMTRYTSYPTLTDAIKGLMQNEIEVIIAEKNRLNKRLKKNFPHRVENIIFHPIPFAVQSNHLTFSKRCEDSTTLRTQFNSGFDAIQRKGILKNLVLKYEEKSTPK